MKILLILWFVAFNAIASSQDDTVLKAYSALPDYQAPSNLEQLSNQLQLLKQDQKNAKALTTDPAKVNAILGTYQLNYSIIKSYTDKLVLDGIYTDQTSGNVYARGLLYPDNSSYSENILCTYSGTSFALINTDYLCIAGTTIISSYALSFNGNSVSGYYSIATDSAVSVNNLLRKLYPVTGNKLGVVNQPVPTVSQLQDEYNASTGDLTLPSVKVGTASYKAILNTKDGTNFVLKSATKN